MGDLFMTGRFARKLVTLSAKSLGVPGNGRLKGIADDRGWCMVRRAGVFSNKIRDETVAELSFANIEGLLDRMN
jgi:hypothetical protein